MRLSILILLTSMLLSGCLSVNSDIEIGDGQSIDRSLNTINGSVSIGSESVIDGNARAVNGSISVGARSVVGHVETVNGKISLGAASTADSVETVNGSVEIGEAAEVDGAVETVNGRVLVSESAVVGGRVQSTNGQIRLQGATAGSLRNLSGGMVLEAGSRVLGELRVVKGNNSADDDPVVVEIYADCEVAGPLVFERPVRLRIHESAEVGEIQGAEPEYFSG